MSNIRMSNGFDPDQARRIVRPDLGPNCLPRLSADDTGRQRVNMFDHCVQISNLWSLFFSFFFLIFQFVYVTYIVVVTYFTHIIENWDSYDSFCMFQRVQKKLIPILL